MDSRSDADLARLARAGNRDAYSELIRRYQHQIWALACILVDDRFEAEDLTRRLSFERG
jgi:DNA-directed RNA polymerase specialized sigma24 family protein